MFLFPLLSAIFLLAKEINKNTCQCKQWHSHCTHVQVFLRLQSVYFQECNDFLEFQSLHQGRAQQTKYQSCPNLQCPMCSLLYHACRMFHVTPKPRNLLSKRLHDVDSFRLAVSRVGTLYKSLQATTQHRSPVQGNNVLCPV